MTLPLFVFYDNGSEKGKNNMERKEQNAAERPVFPVGLTHLPGVLDLDKAFGEKTDPEDTERMDRAEQQGRALIRKHPRADMTANEFYELIKMQFPADAIIKAFYFGVGVGARQK